MFNAGDVNIAIANVKIHNNNPTEYCLSLEEFDVCRRKCLPKSGIAENFASKLLWKVRLCFTNETNVKKAKNNKLLTRINAKEVGNEVPVVRRNAFVSLSP